MSELLFILLVGCTCGMQIVVIFFPVARKKQQLVTLSWPDVFSHNMDKTNLTCLFQSYCRDQHIFWTLNVKKRNIPLYTSWSTLIQRGKLEQQHFHNALCFFFGRNFWTRFEDAVNEVAKHVIKSCLIPITRYTEK